MNSSNRSLLVVLGSLLVMCLCLATVGFVALDGFGQFLSSIIDGSPEAAAKIGGSIAQYTLPVGYEKGRAVTFGDYAMVTYTGADGRSHIYLIQAPPSLAVDQAELSRQMRLASGRDAITEMTVVDNQPCTIRGQETTLVIGEGVSRDDERYRSATAIFQGNEGLALVNISGPATTWDQDLVDNFIASLR